MHERERLRKDLMPVKSTFITCDGKIVVLLKLSLSL